MVLTSLINQLPYFLIIIILAFITTLVSSIAYKYATDQSLIKRLKADIKKLREKQKKHSKDQKKVMALQNEMMTKNMTLLKQSFRPMIYTFIPLILIFAWMSANIAFEPINPGQNFELSVFDEKNLNLSSNSFSVLNKTDIEGATKWTLLAPEESGKYNLTLTDSDNFEENLEIVVTNGKEYPSQITDFSSGTRVELGLKPVKPFGDFSLFGWEPGWLGAYILFSIFFSLIIRKLLGVA